jgi:hypothetical protein
MDVDSMAVHTVDIDDGAFCTDTVSPTGQRAEAREA